MLFLHGGFWWSEIKLYCSTFCCFFFSKSIFSSFFFFCKKLSIIQSLFLFALLSVSFLAFFFFLLLHIWLKKCIKSLVSFTQKLNQFFYFSSGGDFVNNLKWRIWTVWDIMCHLLTDTQIYKTYNFFYLFSFFLNCFKFLQKKKSFFQNFIFFYFLFCSCLPALIWAFCCCRCCCSFTFDL